MRRLIICAVLALSAIFPTPGRAAECEVIVVHVPGLPPTEIEICP